MLYLFVINFKIISNNYKFEKLINYTLISVFTHSATKFEQLDCVWNIPIIYF